MRSRRAAGIAAGRGWAGVGVVLVRPLFACPEKPPGWMDLFTFFQIIPWLVATHILFDVHPYLGNDPI